MDTALIIAFWIAYVLGVYKINKIVERWPDHIAFVMLGFVFIAGWLGFLTLVYWAAQ